MSVASGAVRLGLADHLGWAVVVAAGPDHSVVDRRRIELVEPGVPNMPIHHDSKRLDMAATAALVAEVRASVVRVTRVELDRLADEVGAPITSISLRTWPLDFPSDIAVQVRVPWEARADAVMYRQVLAEAADERGWEVDLYVAKDVVGRASEVLGDQAADVLDGPRVRLGPPWTKDHRTALAATILAAG